MAETRPGPESGLPLERGVRPLVISHGERSVTVDMPGWYREGSDEAVHDSDDLRVSDRALVTLKAEAQGLLTPDQLRDRRARLGLTQADAGRLLGGGPGVVERYERGELMAPRAVTDLLRALEKHPEDLKRVLAGFAPAEERPPGPS